MYMTTVEDRKTKHRTKYFVGCVDAIEDVVAVGRDPLAPFTTSHYCEVSVDTAARAVSNRLSNDIKLINKVNDYLAMVYNEAAQRY